MKRVFFVRHGESEGNTEGIFKLPDSELTKDGHVQSAKLAERFTSMQVGSLFSSTVNSWLMPDREVSDMDSSGTWSDSSEMGIDG